MAETLQEDGLPELSGSAINADQIDAVHATLINSGMPGEARAWLARFGLANLAEDTIE